MSLERRERRSYIVLVGEPRGWLAPAHVVRLLQNAAAVCDVGGLAMTEYLPWEAIATRAQLRQLPLLAGYCGKNVHPERRESADF